MRKMVVLALLLALICGGSANAEQTPTLVKLSAVSSFTSVSGRNGCLSTTTSVTAWDIREGNLSGPRVHDTGDVESPPAVYVAISQVNTCTGELLISGSAVTPVVAEEVVSSGGKLHRVKIQASISLMNEIDGSTLPVMLRVSLLGSGSATELVGDPSSTPLPSGTSELLASAERAATGAAALTINGKRLSKAPASQATLYLVTYRVWA